MIKQKALKILEGYFRQNLTVYVIRSDDKVKFLGLEDNKIVNLTNPFVEYYTEQQAETWYEQDGFHIGDYPRFAILGICVSIGISIFGENIIKIKYL